MQVATNNAVSQEDRAAIELRAASLIDKAKTQCILQHPLYASLLMRLHVRADWRAKSMYTDARVLGYNPTFVISRTVQGLADLLFILVHEVTHCALGHPMRMRALRAKYVPHVLPEAVFMSLCNQAADHAVNLLLKRDPNLKMPADALADPKYEGLNMEQILTLLVRTYEDEQQAKQPPQPQPPEPGNGDGSDGDGDDDSDGSETGDKSDKQDDSDDGEQSDDGDASDELGDSDGDSASDEASDDAEDGDGADADDDTSSDESGDEDGDGAGDEDSDDSKTGNGAADEASDSDGADEIGSGSSHGDIVAPGDAELPGDNEANESGVDEQQATNDEASDEALMREWQEAISAAALGAGDEVGEQMERAFRKVAAKRQSYIEVLERFLCQRAQTTDDWGKRNRRFNDVYLPSRGGVGITRAVFALDTSASITEKMLAQFGDAVERVWSEAGMGSATVVHIDTQIRRVEEYDSVPQFEKVYGGGGTKFAPLFQYVRERIEAGDEIACVIYLTDQENYDGAFVEEYSEIPTLWINPGIAQPAPFGEVCSMLD